MAGAADTKNEPMAPESVTSMRRGLLYRLTALALLSATLPGCLATSWVEKTAGGEPKEAGHFVLSASANSYEITRWWGAGPDTYQGMETVSVPRRDLPAGCETARFFLNDSAHELKIAQMVSANWVTAGRPPLPDDSYPPCAILVSYGSFSEPPPLEGVAVASAAGVVTRGERRHPHPVAWTLLPVGIAADVYIFLGALVTMPVWGPIGLMQEHGATKREREAKENGKGRLPLPVAACWTAIDSALKNGGGSNPVQPFVEFKWTPDVENAPVTATADGVFSDEQPVPIDARVRLRGGRVRFQVKHSDSLWTDADAECGLLAGAVVATRMILRK